MKDPDARKGVIELPHPVDVFLRVGARAVLLGAIGVFLFEVLRGNLPEDPEGGALTEAVLVPLQLVLLTVTGVGLLFSFRWMAIAAATVALGGTGVAVLSALQYEYPVPIFVAIAFLVPAVMMWLDWQCRETLGKIGVLAVATTVLLGAAWIGSNEVYAQFFGPTHPESATPELPDSLVRWVWSGAVDTDGFTVTGMLREPSSDLRLVVTDPDGLEVARSESVVVDDVAVPVRFTVEGLDPATEYRYVLESEGEPDDVRAGVVTTFADGPASVTIALGADARTGSNGAIFDTIRELQPDLYVMMGDLHYRNIDRNDPSLFASAYNQVHDSPARSLLYRNVPIAYVWDDHDFGPDESDSRSRSRPAAWASYRDFVPHYELTTGAAGSINQAFSVGRVRVVMLDTRSYRLESKGTMLGEEQLLWLFDELLAARDSSALTVLVSPNSWIGPAQAGSGFWSAFAEERARIGEFLAANSIENLVLVGGDAHMIAIDDGTNSGYGGDDGFPVLQAAALDRPGSVKGGPYSGGTFPGGGQFGVVEVTDDGGNRIDVELIGLDWEGTVLTSLEVSFDVS